MPDGTFDANMEACCGCGVCEAVCPVEDCITMVNESAFDDNASQWEAWRKDKAGYKTWLGAKIGDKKTTVRRTASGSAASTTRRSARSRQRRRGDHGGDPGRERRPEDGVGRGYGDSHDDESRERGQGASDLGQRGGGRVSDAGRHRCRHRVSDPPYDTVMQAIAKKIATASSWPSTSWPRASTASSRS